MKVLDLFAGIGGGSLGLHQAGFETVGFCEIDPFAQSVLSKNFPNVPIYPDISELTACDLPEKPEVIIGGFPCQDISVAGAGEGLKGSRSGLWYEYKRLISEVKPSYVIIENVAALRSRGLASILKDLDALGYDAEWHIIPASAFGLPHLRERLWVIAYPASFGVQECILERSESFTKTPKKPGFTDGWLSEWLASWIRRRIISRSYGVSPYVVRESIKRYGNALVPAIAAYIGLSIRKYHTARISE